MCVSVCVCCYTRLSTLPQNTPIRSPNTLPLALAVCKLLQLAHKCILNSFYGYVMRKGARWYRCMHALCLDTHHSTMSLVADTCYILALLLLLHVLRSLLSPASCRQARASYRPPALPCWRLAAWRWRAW